MCGRRSHYDAGGLVVGSGVLYFLPHSTFPFLHNSQSFETRFSLVSTKRPVVYAYYHRTQREDNVRDNI